MLSVPGGAETPGDPKQGALGPSGVTAHRRGHGRGRLLASGTMIERLTRGGRANSRCHGDPDVLHGPCRQWTRNVDNNRDAPHG